MRAAGSFESMQFVRHGYPTYHRALSLYSSRNIQASKLSTFENCTLPHHASSKGKAKAVQPDFDGYEDEGSALVAPDPDARQMTDIKGIKPANGVSSTVQDIDAFGLDSDSTFPATKKRKMHRRKRWRHLDHRAPARIVEGGFFQQYLSGPRLPPRTTTVTEVITPKYVTDIIALRKANGGPKAPFVTRPNNHTEVPGKASQPSKKTSRNRRPRPPKISPVVPAPLPITHGFGDVEQRADRCRQAIQERDRNTQGILEGLSRTRGDDSKDESRAGVTEQTSRSESSSSSYSSTRTLQARGRPFSTSSSRPFDIRCTKYFPLNTMVRKYSTPASSFWQLRRPPWQNFARKAPLEIWEIPHTSKEVAVTSMHSNPKDSSSPDSSHISGFSERWNGEDWKDEEWKDAWESNNPPPSNNSPASSSVDLGFWLKNVQERRRLAKTARRMPLPVGADRTMPSALGREDPSPLKTDLLDLLRKTMRRSTVLNESCRSNHGSFADGDVRLSTMSDPFNQRRLRNRLSRETRMADTENQKRLENSQSGLLPPDKLESQNASTRDSSSSHLFAGTEIFSEDGQITTRTGFVPSATTVQTNVPQLDNTATIPGETGQNTALSMSKQTIKSAVDSNSEVTGSSRKKLKAAAVAIRMRAKMALLSQKLAMKYIPRGRRAKRTQTKQRFAVSKDGFSGLLKPLAPGEPVLVDIPSAHKQPLISRLAHGLDRALFSQSVQWLQDPHSRVFNFPPNLQHLPSVTDFAFERLPTYLKTSKDKELQSLALRHSKQFSGSTSSLIGFLSHIYFLISGDRRVDISTLSMAFANESRTFSAGMRLPAMFTLNHRRHNLDMNGEPIETTRGTDICDHSHIDRSANSTDLSESVSGAMSVDSGLNPRDSATSNLTSSSDIQEPTLRQHVAECHSTGALNTGATKSQVMETSLVAEKCSELFPSSSSNDEPSTERSNPVVDADGALLHNVDSMPDLHADRATVSDPVIRPHFDTYAIDAGYSADSRREMEQSLLIWLGTMTEKFLTLSDKEFSYLLRKNSGSETVCKETKEAYRYSKSSNLVVRSQLDCQDSRLPGTGIFDIKTRAVLPIRIDQLNFQENSGYLIRRMTGLLESFEREYYDLIRGAFLKYMFQARIGAMDGVFIVYHNTARMFGFQYVPVTEMEERLYGPGPPERGTRVFEKCIGLMEALLAQIVGCFPGQSVSCTVDTPEGLNRMMIWVTPLSTSSESQPVVEFIVTISHTIDGRPVSSQTAIDEAHANWVLKYDIRRSRRPANEISSALQTAQEERFKRVLPAGVSQDELAARLAKVDWAAGLGLDLQPVVRDEPTAPNESATSCQFARPGRYLRQLRRLALAGKEEIQREEEISAPHVVWGRGVDMVAPDSSAWKAVEEQHLSPDIFLDGSNVDMTDLFHVDSHVMSVTDEEARHYVGFHNPDRSWDRGMIDSADVESALTDCGQERVSEANKGWRAAPTVSVGAGPNLELSEAHTRTYLGPDTLSFIVEQTTNADKIHDIFAMYHL